MRFAPNRAKPSGCCHALLPLSHPLRGAPTALVREGSSRTLGGLLPGLTVGTSRALCGKADVCGKLVSGALRYSSDDSDAPAVTRRKGGDHRLSPASGRVAVLAV